MLTVTDTISQQKLSLFDKVISTKRGEKVYYSPELDNDGNVYYVPMSEQQMVDALIEEDKKGYKTYSVEEVRQKLRDELGLKI